MKVHDSVISHALQMGLVFLAASVNITWLGFQISRVLCSQAKKTWWMMGSVWIDEFWPHTYGNLLSAFVNSIMRYIEFLDNVVFVKGVNEQQSSLRSLSTDV